jgi:hypothetical protein
MGSVIARQKIARSRAEKEVVNCRLPWMPTAAAAATASDLQSITSINASGAVAISQSQRAIAPKMKCYKSSKT